MTEGKVSLSFSQQVMAQREEEGSAMKALTWCPSKPPGERARPRPSF